jgi:putative ABC transport system permease protein
MNKQPAMPPSVPNKTHLGRVDAARKSSGALRETFSIAVDALRAHKLRSALTLLGVILAVTTLVAVMSVLNGLNLYVADKIANLGANAFVVDRIGIITNMDQWNKARKRPPLDMDDLEALKERVPLATAVAGAMQTIADIRYGNGLREDVNINGSTSPAYDQIENIEVSSGRLLTGTDEDHRADVCIIGADVANQFFSSTNAIGKVIRAGAEQYEVVGVAVAKGTVLGQSLDNFIEIPLSTYRKGWLAPLDSVAFFVQAPSPDLMPAAEDEVRVVLRGRRHVPYAAEDNFAIISPTSITGLWNRITGNAFGIAIWVTSVFLVVGGVVIMNIMLASVTERTREIGLRKSLGARRSHIIFQFLVESSLLAASGGTVGVLLALLIALIVRSTTSLPISTPLFTICIALFLSTAVGLFFGIYPAMRAARLDPIEALRAEA